MYKQIDDALQASLRQVAGVPVVVGSNTKFTPQLLTPWVRTTLIPSEPVQLTRGDQRMLQYTSLYQIDVFTPLGATESFDAGSIIKHFNALENRALDVALMNPMVLRAWSNTAQAETNWFRTPIMLRVQWYDA